MHEMIQAIAECRNRVNLCMVNPLTLREYKYGVVQYGKLVVPLVETWCRVEGGRPQHEGREWRVGRLNLQMAERGDCRI